MTSLFSLIIKILFKSIPTDLYETASVILFPYPEKNGE